MSTSHSKTTHSCIDIHIAWRTVSSCILCVSAWIFHHWMRISIKKFVIIITHMRPSGRVRNLFSNAGISCWLIDGCIYVGMYALRSLRVLSCCACNPFISVHLGECEKWLLLLMAFGWWITYRTLCKSPPEILASPAWNAECLLLMVSALLFDKVFMHLEIMCFK